MVSSLHLPDGGKARSSCVLLPTASARVGLPQADVCMPCCLLCETINFYIICIFTTLRECLFNCWGKSWNLIRVMLAWESFDQWTLFGARLFPKCLSSLFSSQYSQTKKVCFVYSNISYCVSLDVSEKAQEFWVCIIKRSSSLESVGGLSREELVGTDW